MRSKAKWYLIAVLLLFFSMSYWLANLYTDWLWFSSLQYQSVFATILFSEMGLRAASGIIFFIFLLANLLFTRPFLLQKLEDFRLKRVRSFDENVVVIQQPAAEKWLEKINKRMVGLLFLLASAVLAFVTGSTFSGDWITLQKFLNATSFGTTDPIFGKDIGFYVFSLPFYRFVLSFLTWITVVAALAVGSVYFLAETLNSNGRLQLLKSSRARLHLSTLAALFFLFKGIDFYLQQFLLLFSERGAVYGAGYTDVHVNLLALKVLAVLSILTAVVILINVFLRRFNLVLYSVIGIIAAAVILNGIIPYVVERFIVEPNQFNREKPYIAHNIEYTRKAYSLDKIETAKFPAGKVLTADDIQQNRETIDNIRLWDWKPLQQTYAQLQEMRLYYEFSDIDIDRYYINGEYRQVMLAPRELNQRQLPSQARTWVNQRLIYTHGYGVAMSPVNEVSKEGLPKFFIKDIPPKGIKDIKITRPEIYFGEKTNEYVIVNTKTKEFDYPKGEKNVYTTYEGESGIKINSLLRKLLFAYVLSDSKILFTGDITPDSQILLYRNIRERVPKVAPFLSFDSDPYIVISGGKLYWMWDAYTTTNMYPYSEPFQGDLNYLRNSVKVVIDAYTGDIDFYIADKEDPLIKCYKNIFPSMFKDLDEMPGDLRAHIRYPIDLFNVQAQMYTNYHMLNAQVFYNKEDRWALPTEIFEGNEQKLSPYYTIIQMPGSEKPEFVQILPFTPTNKKNMIAWLAGRSDGENYGKLLLYEFPKQKLVYGPMQIEARIDQDTTISQQLSLWDQRGSSVIRGNLLVIPVNDSLLYVEPLYLKAEQSSMPELRRVIVAHGDKIVMEPTLEQSLQRIFGQETKAPQPPTSEPGAEQDELQAATMDKLIKMAVQVYNKAQEQLKNGDWAGYGESQKRLKEILDQLDRQKR
ncbi:uncharacterized membrane protein (UPF0182 family) [Desulfohalotomaculum tongense]|uniref:UPF0182 family membrane protein n=1 Tax=Desulforadius tongensis TaxID=1216062 RepID=UPI001958FC5E|nr:UPF0182 family protein [Desulforadius tongensis]MBM7854081.1 uncharacterized membrane protein (UPF0182 family) [Desulforadius tongensis]